MNFKNKLVELETNLAQDYPDSLIKLNLKNPKRITRKMMTDLVPDLPNCDESRKFCESILKSNRAMSKNNTTLRNLIDSKFNFPKSSSEDVLTEVEGTPDPIEQVKLDHVIEEALEDGIEKAVENYVEETLEEETLKEERQSDEEHQSSDNEDKLIETMTKVEAKLDSLIKIVEVMGINAQTALQTSQMVKEKMNDHSKKMDSVTLDNGNNVKKVDHLARVLEMMNKDEVEGISPKSSIDSPTNQGPKAKSKVNRKSYEESKKDQIKMMLGIV